MDHDGRLVAARPRHTAILVILLFQGERVSELEGESWERVALALANESPLVPHRAVSALGTRIL